MSEKLVTNKLYQPMLHSVVHRVMGEQQQVHQRVVARGGCGGTVGLTPPTQHWTDDGCKKQPMAPVELANLLPVHADVAAQTPSWFGSAALV